MSNIIVITIIITITVEFRITIIIVKTSVAACPTLRASAKLAGSGGGA